MIVSYPITSLIFFLHLHFSYFLSAFTYRMVESDIVLLYIWSCVSGIIYVVGPSVATVQMLVVIKCIYLPPAYLHFIQDIEDRYLLLTSSTSFVNLPFQEHRMMEKRHMDQNPCISSLCPK
jgi:hypothetical protein